MLSSSHGTPWQGGTPNHSSSLASPQLGEGIPQVFGSCGCAGCAVPLVCAAGETLPHPSSLQGAAPAFCLPSSLGMLSSAHREFRVFPPRAQSTFPLGWPLKLLHSPGPPWSFGLGRNFMGSSVPAMKPSSFFASLLSCFPTPVMDFGAR